jgi:hypothetical protein
MGQKTEITNQEKTHSLIFSQPMPSDEIEKKSILQKDLKQKKNSNQNNDD